LRAFLKIECSKFAREMIFSELFRKAKEGSRERSSITINI
jgi:hypothetical protein